MRRFSLFLVFTIFLFLLPVVFPLGIAPAQRELTYQQQPQRYKVDIINNERKDTDIFLSVDGDLKDYVKFDEQKLTFTAAESEKEAWYTVTLTGIIDPGSHISKIIAEESLPSIRFGENYVAAKLNVVSMLYLTVPYPEKFVEARLDILPTQEKVDVKANLINKGTQDIQQLAATFSILDQNQEITAHTTPAKSFKQGALDSLAASFQTKDVKPGLYSAVASISYDNKELKLMRDFQVGSINVGVTDFDEYFAQDTINEFNINVESKWNRDIRDAHAQVYVFRNSKEVASFKGPSFDIRSGEKKKTTLYFNTKGLELGEFNAITTLNYANTTSKKEKSIFLVTKEEYDKNKKNDTTQYLLIALITLVVVFIFFMIVILLLLLRKK